MNRHAQNICLVKEIDMTINTIPMYLTKHHPPFQQMIRNIQSTIKTTTAIPIDPSNNKESIRKIALLIYKIMIIQAYDNLWSVYLKMGQDQSIWPQELQQVIVNNNRSMKDIDNQYYLTFIRKQLHILDLKLNECRTQLNILANQFHGYTLQIQTIIKSYIDEHAREFRMKIEHQTELLHYTYQIRALKLEYLRLCPNQFQVISFFFFFFLIHIQSIF